MGVMLGSGFVVLGQRMGKDKTETEEHHHDFEQMEKLVLPVLLALSHRSLSLTACYSLGLAVPIIIPRFSVISAFQVEDLTQLIPS